MELTALLAKRKRAYLEPQLEAVCQQAAQRDLGLHALSGSSTA